MQRGWFTNWFVLHDPFTFVIFWVYFACATASVNRAPFDLAEAESELVGGFHTEYSGLRWSIFFMAEYGSMFAVSGLAAVLFFGGWNGPIPWTDWLGLSTATCGALHYLGNLVGMTNFVIKCVVGVTVMMWIRWTLPRLRIDQVMTVCLKYCTPLAAAALSSAALWLVALPGGLVIRSATPLGGFREAAFATPAEIDAGLAAAERASSLSENRLGEGDSPILLGSTELAEVRRLRKIGTVPDGSRTGSSSSRVPGR
jgi:NADH-quinone oxidoreductase subunit H